MIEPVPPRDTNPAISGPMDVLESLPDADYPQVTILAVNAAFEKIAGTGWERIVHRSFFEVFPAVQRDNAGNDFLASLQRVIALHVTETMPATTLGLPAKASWEGRRWRQIYSPILSNSGAVTHFEPQFGNDTFGLFKRLYRAAYFALPDAIPNPPQ